MNTVEKTIPNYAFNDFLLIINAYGAFLKEKELTKSFNLKNNENYISSLINEHKRDLYSDWDFGLSSSSINDFKDNVKDCFLNEREKLKNNLISTEKYYKKLKHSFCNKYPELKEVMLLLLKEHQNNIQNIKIEKKQSYDKILKLSDRFVSFFHYFFGGSYGSKIGFFSFSKHIINKYDIEIEDKILNNLSLKLDMEYQNNKKIKKLNFEEIQFLADILNRIILCISPEDLQNFEKYINPTDDKQKLKEKIEIVSSVIFKNLKRFSKLHYEYEILLQNYNKNII